MLAIILATQGLYRMIENRYLLPILTHEELPGKAQELVLKPEEDRKDPEKVICYGEEPEHYALPERLEWEIREGFWNKEVNWTEVCPQLSEVQRNAMDGLGARLKYGSKTEDEAICVLMDGGCSREEAEQALALYPIDFEKQAAFRAAGWLKTSSVSQTQMLEDLAEVGFTREQAQAGLDRLGVDWENQARLCVSDNLQRDHYSRDRLLELLVIWGFSQEQADQAMENCIADWNAQAEKAAQRILAGGTADFREVVRQLENEKFTHEQAVSGALAVGLTENKNP